MTRSDQDSCFARTFWMAVVVCGGLWLTTTAAPAVQAQTFTILHQFTGGLDGANPSAGLTFGRGGGIYGTSSGSAPGTIGAGFSIAESQSDWLLNPLYRFLQFGQGLYPNTRLIPGPDGAFYGTTWKGGNGGCAGQGCGVVFKLRPPATLACRIAFCPWTETVLYSFAGAADGSNPGPVILDGAGNIYGTTYYGGAANCQCGTVYELKLSGGTWSKTILHSFDGADGANPDGPLTLDRLGNLYGTAIDGGSASDGVVYELSPSGQSWTETVLHNFQGGDGIYPNGGLIADPSGNLYGVTAFGGPAGLGVVFAMTQPGQWDFQALYSFMSSAMGASPHGPLTLDPAGNLYGITDYGRFGDGTVFRLTRSNQTWTAIDLHDFDGSDGNFLNPGVIVDSGGNVYGTAFGDSQLNACYPTGCGNVWQIAP